MVNLDSQSRETTPLQAKDYAILRALADTRA